MDVRPLTEADAAAFQAVRLRALREHPEAYGWTEEEERAAPAAALTDRPWADWSGEEGFLLGAFDGGRLVGTVGCLRFPRSKQRHKATIRAVYVAPEARGHGVARALLVAAVARARGLPGLEQLELSVGVGNAAARAVYAAVGFEAYGVERRALKVGDRYVDEELMALRLR